MDDSIFGVVAIISRTHGTNQQSAASPFELSKLMTFVEFFCLGRASSVVAARLTLDTKTSPLLSLGTNSDSSSGGGGGGTGGGKFLLSSGLSTFVETAAISGGAALSTCRSQSFGTNGSSYNSLTVVK